jgi:hypothetical protein
MAQILEGDGDRLGHGRRKEVEDSLHALNHRGPGVSQVLRIG